MTASERIRTAREERENMTEQSIETLAREAASWFETAERPDGESFTRTKDDTPEWVKDLVHDAHGSEFLPDDWRYATIREALDFLADGGDPVDAGEFADQAVDVYTGSRFAWLSSNLNRAGYVDEAIQEFGFDAEQGIVGMVGLGQYAEASEIFGLVVQALEEQLG